MASLFPGFIFVFLIFLDMNQVQSEEMVKESSKIPIFLHKQISTFSEGNGRFLRNLHTNSDSLFNFLARSLANEERRPKMNGVGREKKSVSLLNKIYSTGFTPLTFYGGIRTRGGSKELLSPKSSSNAAETGEFGQSLPRKPGFRLRWGK